MMLEVSPSAPVQCAINLSPNTGISEVWTGVSLVVRLSVTTNTAMAGQDRSLPSNLGLSSYTCET